METSKLLAESFIGDRTSVEMEELIQIMSELQLSIRLKNKEIKIDSLLPELKITTSRIY